MSDQFRFSMEGTYMDFGNSKNSKTPNIKTSYSDIFSCWERSYSNKTDTDSCASFLLIANLGIHTHCKQPLKSSMFKDMQITISTSRVQFFRVIDIIWGIVITIDNNKLQVKSEKCLIINAEQAYCFDASTVPWQIIKIATS